MELVVGPDGQPADDRASTSPADRCRPRSGASQVGRVPLYLLDTNIAAQHSRRGPRASPTSSTAATRRCASGRRSCSASAASARCRRSGSQPTVCHMNEGHSAFLALERIRQLMAHARPQPSARRANWRPPALVFTTHTPVPAGHDHFPPELMDRYFGDYGARAGTLADGLPGARAQEHPATGEFCMTVLALAHGRARQRRQPAARRGQPQDVAVALARACPEDEMPIGHVTNGVHFRTWISPEMNQLYDRYLGLDWREDPAETATSGAGSSQIPDEELWRTHERRRERLVAFARRAGARPAASGRGCLAAEIEARRRGPRSRRADHRLRPPLRHLQAGDPPPARLGPPAEASSPTRSGRCRSSSPARRTRRTTRARS